MKLITIITKRWLGILAAFITLTFLSLVYAQENDPIRTSLSWPSQRSVLPKSERITSTFAESRTTRFHLGVDLYGDNVPVYPLADNGKVLYYHLQTNNPFKPILGSGNTLFIEYDNHLVSGYFHLSKNSFYASHLGDTNQLLSRTTEVARSGNSGRSYGAHLHFFIYDKHEKILINPQKILQPKLTDSSPPKIVQLAIVRNPNDALENSSTLLFGIPNATSSLEISNNYPVYVYVTESSDRSNSRLGIYKIQWIINQQKSKQIVFDKCSIANGKQWVCGGHSFRDVFYRSFYHLKQAKFIQGFNTIIIQVEDFSGNRNRAEFSINVNFL